MTCREFKHIAASFSLRELARQQDAPMFDHVESCAACGAWMAKQRSLNASMHTLRMRTAGLEAGRNVEGALLRVFRQGTPVTNASTSTEKFAVVAGTRRTTGVTERRSQAASRSTPFALCLSRFFEVGAYAAVAAAILVALVLGVHLLRHGHDATTTEGKSVPTTNSPLTGAARGSAAARASVAQVAPRQRTGTRHAAIFRSVQRQGNAEPAGSSDDTPTNADGGYLALMFCDPLSCASDTQVVRMELPAAEGAQPQTADVVVGYDGVVRAVRFVN